MDNDTFQKHFTRFWGIGFASVGYFVIVVACMQALSVVFAERYPVNESEENDKCTLRIAVEIITQVWLTTSLLYVARRVLVGYLFPFGRKLLVPEIRSGTMFTMLFSVFYRSRLHVHVKILSRRLGFIS